MMNASLLSRRQVLLSGAALCASGLASAQTTTLPLAVALQDELAQALQKGQPLVVMVSLAGCPFCKVARENYLAPLHTQQGLPVVQVDMHSQRGLKNFSGASLSHEDQRRAWGVRTAPTLLFLGPGGREVAPRLVGASIPDFYGAYLEQRLQQAQAALRQIS